MQIRIILKSFDNKLINNTLNELKLVLINSNYIINYIVSLPIKIKKFCVLRSPHIDKNSREHFEIRLYKKFIDIEINSMCSFNSLLKYNLPAGVSCLLKIL